MANRPGHKPRRHHPGPAWNEGARQLWIFLRRRGISARQFGVLVRTKDQTRILYGDRRPGRDLGNRIEQETGIPSSAFSKPALEPLTDDLTGAEAA